MARRSIKHRRYKVTTDIIAGTPQTYNARDIPTSGGGLLARVETGGFIYYLTPVERWTLTVEDANESGWKLVGEPEQSRRSKAAKTRSKGLSAAEKKALDAWVLAFVEHQGLYGPTPTMVAIEMDNRLYDILGPYDGWSEYAREMNWSRKKAVAAVRASLNRLVARGTLFAMYGLGLRGREATVYVHSKYKGT